MHLGSQETFTYRAGSKHGIVVRLFVPRDLLDCFRAASATADIHIEIAPGADKCSTIRFTLADVFSALRDPPGESLHPAGHIIESEGR